MIDAWLARIAAHPILAAMALCYVLTFFAVRQGKPFLIVLSDVPALAWLPEALRRRWLLRLLVFVCGALVSAVVTTGLIVFECCAITGLQAGWVALSVGIMAPVVYDVAMFALDLLEWLKVLPAPVRDRIDAFFDRPEAAMQPEGENDA